MTSSNNTKRGYTQLKDANGNWRPVRGAWVKQNDTWKPIQTGWVKDNDIWHQIYPNPIGILSPSPASLVFSTYATYSTSPQVLTLLNSGSDTFTVNRVDVYNTPHSVMTIQGNNNGLPFALSPGESVAVDISINGLVVGQGSGKIVLTGSTGVLGSTTVTIPITVTVLADYAAIDVIPKAVFINFRKDQSGVDMPNTSLTINNTGNGGRLFISSVVSESNRVQITGYPNDISPYSVGTISFVPYPNSTPGVYTDTILISSNAQNFSTLSIPVRIEVTDFYADINVANTLVFEYYQGVTKSLNVSITNTGNGDVLNIDNITSDQGLLTFSNIPSSVLPGATAKFTATSTTTTVGSYTDTITISSNAKSGSETKINVTINISIPHGNRSFTSPGTYTWVVPDGVYGVTTAVVGAGGGGGGGDTYTGEMGQPGTIVSGLLAVTPGDVYTVYVGDRGAGGPGGGYISGGPGGFGYSIGGTGGSTSLGWSGTGGGGGGSSAMVLSGTPIVVAAGGGGGGGGGNYSAGLPPAISGAQNGSAAGGNGQSKTNDNDGAAGGGGGGGYPTGGIGGAIRDGDNGAFSGTTGSSLVPVGFTSTVGPSGLGAGAAGNPGIGLESASPGTSGTAGSVILSW